MSKGRPPRERTPQEKKALSLTKDRRNTYGENDKSSRKSIRTRKALALRGDRHAAKQTLDQIEVLDEAKADTVESSLRQDVDGVRRWRKVPDEPLGRVLGRKDHVFEVSVDFQTLGHGLKDRSRGS